MVPEQRPLSPKSDEYIYWLDTMTPFVVVRRDGTVIHTTLDRAEKYMRKNFQLPPKKLDKH